MRAPAWWLTTAPAAVVATAVLLRRRHERRLQDRSTGVGPGVRTDDGVLLHTEVDDPAGPVDVTVVLCHGFGAAGQVFRSQRETLRGRARVVLYDQRGHHESGWSGRRGLTMDRLADDLSTVVDRVAGPGPVVLVGHSLGALTILALAGRRPEMFGPRVVGVGLLSGSSGRLLETVVPDAVARLLVRSGGARALLWGAWLLAPVADVLRPAEHRWGQRVLRQRMYGSGPVTDEAREQVREMWLGTSQSKAVALLPALVGFDGRAALPVLGRVPTLLLAGTEDATIPVSHTRRMARQVGSSARCRLVEGAGHMVPVTHPDVVDEELVALLRRVVARQEGGTA